MLNLRAAIDNLFHVFATYRVGASVAGCDCCVSARESEKLATTPLSSLEVGDLEQYAFKALWTWGTVNDFKYFLPRIFELVTTNRQEFASVEVVFGKLALAEWLAWPVEEVDAVRAYFHALWSFVIENRGDSHLVGGVLCGIGRAETDLSPYLQEWRQRRSLNALEHLASFVFDNVPSLQKKGRLSNPFWRDRLQQEKQVVEWLTETDTLRNLESGVLLEGASDQMLDGVEVLAVWQKRNVVNS